MSSIPAQPAIIKAVLSGIQAAKKNYFFWTNDRLFLSYGPQKIITIHIAQALGAMEDAPEIFIDATVADILRCSLPERTAYPAYMKAMELAQGVFSITIDERFPHESDNDSISKVIISVKNGVRSVKQEYKKEIERICKMLSPHNPSHSALEYGIFAFYADLSESARKKLDRRIPQIVASFDEVVAAFPLLEASFVSPGVQRILEAGEWCAGCYVIQPKASR